MHLTDVYNAARTVRFGPISGHPGPGTGFVQIPPPPGDSDTGGILGAIIDVGVDILRGRVPSLPRFPALPPGTAPALQGGAFPPVFGGAFPDTVNGNRCPTQACCKGEHLNKGVGCDGLPPGSKCVKNRRMNSLNPQALRRATRRLKGFERAVKTTRKQLRTLAKI